VNVAVKQDRRTELTETFRLVVSGAPAGFPVTSFGTATIVDDD
jgi:hypothetical protein